MDTPDPKTGKNPQKNGNEINTGTSIKNRHAQSRRLHGATFEKRMKMMKCHNVRDTY